MKYFKWIMISLGVTTAHAYVLMRLASPITPSNDVHCESESKPEFASIMILSAPSQDEFEFIQQPHQKPEVIQNICDELEYENSKCIEEKHSRKELREKKQQQEKLAEQKRLTEKSLKKKQQAKKKAQQLAEAKRLNLQKKREYEKQRTLNEKHAKAAKQKRKATLAKKIAKQPSIIRKTSPSYPSALRRKGIEGRVTVLVYIDRDGKVSSASISKSSGHSAFDQTALKAIRRWRYRPAVNGLKQTVSYKKYERITFKLK